MSGTTCYTVADPRGGEGVKQARFTPPLKFDQIWVFLIIQFCIGMLKNKAQRALKQP